MKRKILFFILSIFLLTSLRKDVSYEVKQKKDFEIFLQSLIDFQASFSINELEKFNFLNTYFENKLTNLQQFKLYSKYLSELNCGHTYILPSKKVFEEWVMMKKSLPFDYIIEGKKLIVKDLLEEDLSLIHIGKLKHQQNLLPIHSEILTIDNKDINSMMNRIGEFVSSDENDNNFKYYRTSQLFEFYRNLVFDTSLDSLRIKYKYNNDTVEVFVHLGYPPVKTINKRISKFYKQQEISSNKLGEFKIVNDKVGLFTFRSFKNSYSKRFYDFLDQSFLQLKEKKIQNLVIDLRNNTGGVMQYEFMNYFLSEKIYLGEYIIDKLRKNQSVDYLIKDQSFKNYKRICRNKKLNEIRLGKVYTNGQLKVNKYSGKIYVLTNEGTFSSASILACHLKTLANATIVGTSAGGSFYEGNSGSLNVKLPNNEFMFLLNPFKFRSHLSKSNNSVSIKNPDVFYISKGDLNDIYLILNKLNLN